MKNRGIIFIILSALSFAFMTLFVRLAGDLPFYQKCFFRNIVALLVATIMVIKIKNEHHLGKGNKLDLLLRALFGTIGLFCNFYAVDNLNLSDASMLNKMSPFFAIIASCFILREKVSLPQFLIVLTAFFGSLLIIKPSFTNISFFPALVGLIGGFGAGVAYTFVRKLGKKNVQGPYIVLAFSLISTLLVIPFLIFDYHPMTLQQLLYLLGAGIFATFGQFLITAAYSCAPAKEISIYDYSQIIFTTILGFFFLNQIPDYLSFIGYGVIIAMAIIMFFYNNRKAHLN